MNRLTYIQSLASLSAEEGVFTTAQAERFEIPRDALSRACASGKLERVARGAYRSTAVAPSYLDEVVAAWKLTAPAELTFERMARESWDGIAVGGSTASSVLGIGDFYLTPIRMFSSKRFNSRNPKIKMGIRAISRDDVTFKYGFAVTGMERTIVDLVLDDEDLSLVQGVIEDALDKGFDPMRLRSIVSGLAPRMRGKVNRAFAEGGLHGI